MFGKLISDLIETAEAVVKVATLPVAVTASVAKEFAKPLGDLADDAAKAVSEGLSDTTPPRS